MTARKFLTVWIAAILFYFSLGFLLGACEVNRPVDIGFTDADTIVVLDDVILQPQTAFFPLDIRIVNDDEVSTTMAIPEHFGLLGVDVWADIELSGESQGDEAFGLRLNDGEIGGTECPVVPDHPWLGRGMVSVGRGEWTGTATLTIRHASLYDCYGGIDRSTPNSVQFHGIELRYWVTR